MFFVCLISLVALIQEPNACHLQSMAKFSLLAAMLTLHANISLLLLRQNLLKTSISEPKPLQDSRRMNQILNRKRYNSRTVISTAKPVCHTFALHSTFLTRVGVCQYFCSFPPLTVCLVCLALLLILLLVPLINNIFTSCE